MGIDSAVVRTASFALVFAAIATRPALAVEETKTGEASGRIEELTVYGARSAFMPGNPTSTALLGGSTLATARSVQVVNEEILDAFRVIDVADSAQFLSGVTRGTGDRGPAQTFVIRGFAQQQAFQDGFRVSDLSDNIGGSVAADQARISAVEVLKGPATVLYGRGEPGGVVNYVTKEPEFEPILGIRQDLGTEGFVRTELDLNQPLGDRWAARLNAAYSDVDGEVDNEAFETLSFSPSILYRPNEDTRLKLRADVQTDDQVLGGGVVAPDETVVFAGDPDNSDTQLDQILVMGQLDHAITDRLSTQLAVQFVEDDIDRVTNGAFVVLPDFTTLLGVADVDTTNEQVSVKWVNDYRHRFALPGGTSVESRTVFGLQYETLDRDSFRGFALPLPFGGTLPPFNALTDTPTVSFATLDETETGNTDVDETSVLFLETLTMGRLVLQAGFRYSQVDVETTFVYGNGLFTGSATENEFDPFNPSASALFRFTDEISGYYSWSESFAPTIGNTADGSDLDPETGELHEIGVKYAPTERLLLTASLYRVTKEDTLGPDPMNPLFSVNIGEERAEGLELDTIGNVTEALSVSFNFAWNDAEIRDDGATGALDGNQRYGSPKYSGSLFLTYGVLHGRLRGWTVGGGMIYRDEVFSDNTNATRYDSYTQFELFASYEAGPWRFGLNGKNLSDENILIANNGIATASQQLGRQVIVSASYGF